MRFLRIPFIRRKPARTFSLWQHIALLLLFALGMIFLWELPVMTMGYPHIFPYIGPGHTFSVTGLIPADEGRLQVLLVAFFGQWIKWDAIVDWSLLSAAVFALTLLPFWFGVRKLFDEKIAWISTVLLALTPLYWLQAVTINKYAFSFLFLFLSFTAFVLLMDRTRFGALITAGIFMGICIAIKDTFLIFLPWLLLSYLWWQRETWKRASVEAFAGLACIGVIFIFSFAPNLLAMEGVPWNQRVSEVLSFSRTTPSTGELYGDEYTYQYDREWFEEDLLRRRSEEQGFLENIQQQHRLISFGVGEQSMVHSLGSGFWLFLNRIPELFYMDTAGGIVLWLFIIPGLVVCYRKNRKLLWFLLGLMVTSDLIVRFVLHFQRSHIMNAGWALVILAAVGIVTLSDVLAQHHKRIGTCVIALIITTVLSVHLLQVNRKQFARLYTHSLVPRDLAIAERLKEAPQDATVLLPIYGGFNVLSDRGTTSMQKETVERLLERGTLAEAFNLYGVTHVMEFSDELSDIIQKAVPGVRALPSVEVVSPQKDVPLVVNYLLHLFR
ncbi:MAG: glycosyltransferase family 39 protein [Patescibacteria group bacterium]